MESITGIMDMDGFVLEKVFHCKELGCIKQGQTYATSTLFDLGLRWNNLSEKSKTVHGSHSDTFISFLSKGQSKQLHYLGCQLS